MDGESVKKSLRSVLQSNQGGVPIGWLQADYRSMCGELIPYTRLGYPVLMDYLRTIPSVVRMEHRMGEPEVYNVELVQSRLSELLAKHWHGMWLSKLPGVDLDIFSQTIPPEALDKLDTWTHICSVRLHSCRSHGIK
ncbi:hypothetical protein NHX12_006214 [Muraenolepis orangiensis]|uniref:HTH OST-type domain-containing protein n=1 Tax=Muraenolepis orangiensis TaxID=630683 RepID=A0A9Q0DS44_9TELE|nr:hypothetical protein NHX12_017020 [Muraenolepis orangiensis]KAJ3593880.1 hypothetical protein NHX12_006214 [Muraenolepis orangiensis]